MKLNQYGILFGTSGARGLVEQFTDEVCAAFTTAFLSTINQQWPIKRLAIAIDRRPSSPAMAAACIGMAKVMGYQVDYYGVLPTPALALKAMHDGIPAIMITGSHIPFDRNGIKFYRPDGEITKYDESLISSADVTLIEFSPELPEPSILAKEYYLDYFKQLFPTSFLCGKRIGVYEHSAAGREITTELLAYFGAEVISLGRSDEFVPIDTEAVSNEDRQRGVEWSQQYRLDAVVSTDGDGDRPLVADEQGQWLRGDLLGLLCAQTLGIQALAVPVSCNSAIEESGSFKKVTRTRIGSPYVIEGMAELSKHFSSVAGFEANGGFLTDYLPTRDALLPVLALFKAAYDQQKPISALVEALPKRFTASDRLKNIPTELSKQTLALWEADLQTFQQDLSLEFNKLDNTDGLRVTLSNNEIIHLRPSGNAPELRCYVEAFSIDRAEALLKNTLNIISKKIYL